MRTDVSVEVATVLKHFTAEAALINPLMISTLPQGAFLYSRSNVRKKNERNLVFQNTLWDVRCFFCPYFPEEMLGRVIRRVLTDRLSPSVMSSWTSRTGRGRSGCAADTSTGVSDRCNAYYSFDIICDKSLLYLLTFVDIRCSRFPSSGSPRPALFLDRLRWGRDVFGGVTQGYILCHLLDRSVCGGCCPELLDLTDELVWSGKHLGMNCCRSRRHSFFRNHF